MVTFLLSGRIDEARLTLFGMPGDGSRGIHWQGAKREKFSF
jgi:hypothetical protein